MITKTVKIFIADIQPTFVGIHLKGETLLSVIGSGGTLSVMKFTGMKELHLYDTGGMDYFEYEEVEDCERSH